MGNVMHLAQGHSYSLDCFETQLNNNVLVVGTSGAGKTRGIVEPNLLEATGSYVVSDPKGNLYNRYKKYLRARGYEVLCLDLTRPDRSIHYNFFKYIHNTQDILKIAHLIIAPEKSKGNIDPFWDQCAETLLTALIGYLCFFSPEREPRVEHILKLIACGKRSGEDYDAKTALDLIFDEVRKKDRSNWVITQYDNVNVAAQRTWESILVSVSAKFAGLDTPEIRKMMQGDQTDLAMIGQRKTALFVIVSDTDRSMDSLANMFFTQAMNELCLYADHQCRGSKLPVPVRFILDDFATNCRIDEFPRMIASIRSRGISTMLMIQAESQLEAGYGEDYRTIIGNCDTYVYLGGNDVETAKMVAERCDLPVKKILYMPIRTCWIFRRGTLPINAKTIDLEQFLLEGAQKAAADDEGKERKDRDSNGEDRPDPSAPRERKGMETAA